MTLFWEFYGKSKPCGVQGRNTAAATKDLHFALGAMDSTHLPLWIFP